MWALMWTGLCPAQIGPGCLTGRHLAFKYCLAPTIVITLSLVGRIWTNIIRSLKINRTDVKVRLRAVNSFMK